MTSFLNMDLFSLFAISDSKMKKGLCWSNNINLKSEKFENCTVFFI